MAQLFPRYGNPIARAVVYGTVPALLLAAIVSWFVYRSSWVTRAHQPIDQPVPFSHQHHVAGLGLDCRYCHTSVETSSFAGIPPIHTCMTCHSQIWNDSPMLEPIREAYRTGRPIRWVRVHDLPEFVFFDHSIHVAKGIGCADCHGRVDRMPLTMQVHTLHMRWCLDCHRAPKAHLRPKGAVFDMAWQAPPDQMQRGAKLAEAYAIPPEERMTDCVTCHR